MGKYDNLSPDEAFQKANQEISLKFTGVGEKPVLKASIDLEDWAVIWDMNFGVGMTLRNFPVGTTRKDIILHARKKGWGVTDVRESCEECFLDHSWLTDEHILAMLDPAYPYYLDPVPEKPLAPVVLKAPIVQVLATPKFDLADFTVDEALKKADENAASHKAVPSVSRVLAAEVRRLQELLKSHEQKST